MKALIIGNAPIPIRFWLNGYEEVLLFNKTRHDILLPHITQHWLRWGGKEKGFAGECMIGMHPAKLVACYGDDNDPAECKALEKYQKEVIPFPIVKEDYSNYYETEKDGRRNYYPSTGFMAIKHFIDKGYDVTLVGFTFKGATLHNWDFEQRYAQEQAKNGKLRFL